MRCLQADYRHYTFAALAVAVAATLLVKRTERGDRMLMQMVNDPGTTSSTPVRWTCWEHKQIMKLAKPHLDIGLFTNDLASQRKFWGTTAGLPLDHELELEPGWIQHRFAANGSIVKVNHLLRPLPALPASGYVGLSIAQDHRSQAWSGQHPGGDAVDLVATGAGGVVGIGITVASANPDRLLDFYQSALEFEPVDERTSRRGDTLVTVVEGAGGSDVDDVVGPGFRYLTVQVFDVDAEAAEIVRRGARVVREPVNYAGVARYGFIADPDGNWIELSARTSLTGIQIAHSA